MKHFSSFGSNSSGSLPAYSRWEQRRRQLAGLLLPVLLFSGVQVAQASVVLTVGTTNGATYPTITAALAAVPSPLTQAYELQLTDAAYAENVLLTKTGTAANTLTIKPAQGVSPVITGTLTFGAGSAFTILNGNNGNSASTARALTVRQPSLSVPAVVFSGDASDNAIQETVVLGSNTLLASGVVVVGDGLTTGNDRNTIDHSFVGNATPACCRPTCSMPPTTARVPTTASRSPTASCSTLAALACW